MELAKKTSSKLKTAVMIVVSMIIATVWTLAFTQSAHARGAVAVAARAAPVASVARSAPSVSYSAPAVRSTPVRSKPVRRATPVTPVTNPALRSKSGKNCNLEQNKKLKECIAKQKH